MLTFTSGSPDVDSTLASCTWRQWKQVRKTYGIHHLKDLLFLKILHTSIGTLRICGINWGKFTMFTLHRKIERYVTYSWDYIPVPFFGGDGFHNHPKALSNWDKLSVLCLQCCWCLQLFDSFEDHVEQNICVGNLLVVEENCVFFIMVCAIICTNWV